MITVYAYAKINLMLDICGRLPNGYHDLSMVMQSVSLCDVLTAETASAVELFCANPEMPTGEKSLVRRAANAFFDATGRTGGVRFTIDSRIPMQAGLGGGSADCAAALRALDTLYKTHLTDAELCAIGVKLGADVPFCLCGGTQFAQGIGERLRPLTPLSDGAILLIKPPVGASTAEQFARSDAIAVPHPSADRMMDALDRGLPAVADALGNSFEAVIGLPEIPVRKAALMRFGARGACMTGSGSTVFGLFDTEADAQSAADRCCDTFPTDFIAVCRPESVGCRIFAE